MSKEVSFQISFLFFVKSLSNASWTKWTLRACFIDCLRSRMIVFRTKKEFSHFAVEAPRVTPSFSARCTAGIVLSASQCSERSLVVAGFIFSLPLNFAT